MLISFVSIALAAETASVPVQQSPDPGMAALFFRLLISLAFIVLLIYLVLKFIKNQQSLQQKMREQPKEWIRILDYQGLGTNKGMYLIEIINKTYVLAVSEHSISTICELDNPEEGQPGFIQSNSSSSKTTGINLSDIVKGILKKCPLQKNTGSFQKELNKQLQEQLEEQTDRTHRILEKLTKGGTDGAK